MSDGDCVIVDGVGAGLVGLFFAGIVGSAIGSFGRSISDTWSGGNVGHVLDRCLTAGVNSID